MPLSRDGDSPAVENGDDARIPLLQPAVSQGASLAHNVASLLSDWWLWEIIGACTSIVALTIIAVLLFVFDGSSLPDWPSVFTVRLHVPVVYYPRLTIFYRSIPLSLFFPPFPNCVLCPLLELPSANANGSGIASPHHGNYKTCSCSMMQAEDLGVRSTC